MNMCSDEIPKLNSKCVSIRRITLEDMKKKITVNEAKDLFKAMINNWHAELSDFGFSNSEILELENFTQIHRDALSELEEIRGMQDSEKNES